MSSAALTEQEDAAALLRALLQQPGRYRDRWVHRAEKRREGEISQAAVARVIADHLQLEPKGSDPAFRTLRARVSRALNGQNLTAETLAMFLAAFSISENDARILWAALSGNSAEDFEQSLQPLALPPSNAAGFKKRNYKVTSLRETHFLDAQGLPARHTLTQDIVALTSGVDRIPVKWDTRSLKVIEASGAVSEIYAQSEGMYAFDIMLPKPLRQGERGKIFYTVELSYTHAQHHFRRHALQEIENASVEIHFDPRSIPNEVWWASWNSALPEARPLTKERMSLEGRKGIVSKSIAFAADCVVGFFWTWNIGSNQD